MSDRQRLVGLGAGGHAAVMIETYRAIGGVEIAGLLAPHGEEVLGVPVIGNDEKLATLKNDGIDAVFLGIGMMKNASIRKMLVARSREVMLEIVGAIHPSAIIAHSAQMGRGVQILAGAIIQARAVLGDHVLINTGAIVEHDGRIGDFSHVATGAHLAGGVDVGEGAFIGAGAVVIPSIAIGAGAIVGAGAVVIHDVSPGTTVVGVPARPLRSDTMHTDFWSRPKSERFDFSRGSAVPWAQGRPEGER